MSAIRRSLINAKGNSSIPNYLCFTCEESGVITFNKTYGLPSSEVRYIEYSINEGRTWARYTIANAADTLATPELNVGNKVYWRGDADRFSTNNSYRAYFTMTGKFSLSGNLMSLFYPTNFETATSFPNSNRACYKLFYNCISITDAQDLIMPATSGDSMCYQETFRGCSSMLHAPQMSLTSGTSSCLESTFTDCSAMLDVPSMHLTSIGTIANLFKNCASIVDASSIIIDSFTSASNIFSSCTNLQKSAIFTQATIPASGFIGAFSVCKALNWVKMLATDVSASSALSQWMNSVKNSSDCVFVKHIDAQWTNSGASGVPTNWTIIYYDPAVDKYYTDRTRATECDDHGNPI